MGIITIIIIKHNKYIKNSFAICVVLLDNFFVFWSVFLFTNVTLDHKK